MSIDRSLGTTGEWEVVIGLEVHAQVMSNAKSARWRQLTVLQKLGNTSAWRFSTD